MKNNVNQKKAALSLEMIVSVIILLIGAVVVIGFYALYNWTSTIDREACHQSVVFRATANAGTSGFGGGVVPLSCQTEKICITQGDGCVDSRFGTSSRENLVTTIRVNGDGETQKRAVTDAIINAIADCHTMLGEGKLDFMPTEGNDERYCLICSRIAMDAQIREAVPSITYIDMYQRMRQRTTSNDRTYLDALYGVESVNDMIPGLELVAEKAFEKNPSIQSASDLTIDLTKENAVVVQIVKEGYYDPATWVGAGAVGAGLITVGILGAPFSFGSSLGLAVTGVALVSGGTAAGVLYTRIVASSEEKLYVLPTIVPYDLESLSGLGCTSFETAP